MGDDIIWIQKSVRLLKNGSSREPEVGHILTSWERSSFQTWGICLQDKPRGGLTRGQGAGAPAGTAPGGATAGGGREQGMVVGWEGGWGGGRLIPGLRFWRGLNVYCFGMFGNVGHVLFGHTVTTPPGSLRRAILVQVEPHGEGGVCTVREKKNHLIKNIRPGRSRMQRGDIGNHSRWKFQ